MSKRYKLHGKWTTDYTYEARPYDSDDPPTQVVVEVCDLIDTYNGHVYEEGAFRVKADGERTKVFKGETAWSDARRLADDLVWKIRRGD